jgi:enoyl-CoA hydratase
LKAIQIERLEDVLRITIAHPDRPLNAIDGLLHDELGRVFSALRLERSARAAIITGEGKAFSAGGDRDWFPSLQSTERLAELSGAARRLIWDLVEVEIPVIAALNGAAVGLGATIALLCDLVIAAEEAVIGDPHVRVGIVAGDGGTGIWPLLVGTARAKQYLLTGEIMPAVEAERIGLINRVVPGAELAGAALELAHRLAALPPLAVKFTKAALNQQVKVALNLSFESAAGHELFTLLSEDHREALAAMSEGRQPYFQGR